MPRAVRRQPLLAVLAVGAILRLLLMAAYWPTGVDNRDVWPYVNAARTGVFSDALHPPGYAIYLRMLHGVSTSAVLPTLVQHALGLAAAALLYAAARRLGASKALACVPAAAVALSGDQLSIEHLLMSDALFGALVAAATYLFVRARTDESVRRLAFVGCGAALGGAYLVRSAGSVLIPIFLVGMAFAASKPWKAAPARLLAGVAGVLLVVAPVLLVQHHRTGRWNPNEASGWAIYTKAAPFADCSRFDPPAGTEFLCESSDPSTRPGPDFYGWQGGPGRAAYPDFRLGNDTLSAFGTAAIMGQPLDYGADVLREFARFFVPGLGSARPNSGRGAWGLKLDYDASEDEVFAEATLEMYYDDFTIRDRQPVLGWLNGYQTIARGNGFWLSVTLAVATAGFVVASAGRRRWLALLTVLPLASLGFSTAVGVYTWRYAVPLFPLAVLAGVIGAQSLLDRRGLSRVGSPPRPMSSSGEREARDEPVLSGR